MEHFQSSSISSFRQYSELGSITWLVCILKALVIEYERVGHLMNIM